MTAGRKCRALAGLLASGQPAGADPARAVRAADGAVPGGQLLRLRPGRHLPGVHPGQLPRAADHAGDAARLCQLAEIRRHRLGDHAVPRLQHRLFSDLPRAQRQRSRTVLFLLCAIPFWTSGIIRTIAWIPFLGRNGAFNTILQDLHITSQPLTFLLFSDFAVVVTYVHLFTLLMVGPDRQLAGEDRPGAAGGGTRRRRQPLAHHGRRGDPAVARPASRSARSWCSPR